MYGSIDICIKIHLSMWSCKWYWGRIQRKTWCMGLYAGVDYNHTLCRLQHR